MKLHSLTHILLCFWRLHSSVPFESLREQHGGGGGGYLADWRMAWPTHAAHGQTFYLAAQWVNRTTGLSACHTHMQLILQTACKVCLTDAGCPTWKYRNGEGPCACDPLALRKQGQWKIVPTANPWQANYSFDPHGMSITIGGREAVDSGVQYIYVYFCFGLNLWEKCNGLPTLVNRLIPHYDQPNKLTKNTGGTCCCLSKSLRSRRNPPPEQTRAEIKWVNGVFG